MRISDWSSDVCSSDLRCAASTLRLACASFASASRVAASASASLSAASLKAGGPLRAPRLLFVGAGRFDGGEQHPGQPIEIERIGPGGCDQLAHLLDILRLEDAGLVAPRLHICVIVADLPPLTSLPPMIGRG